MWSSGGPWLTIWNLEVFGRPTPVLFVVADRAVLPSSHVVLPRLASVSVRTTIQ
jgi:hypothetical protein